MLPSHLGKMEEDILESYIREALDQKLIDRNGAWYTYKDIKVMGLNGLKQQFINTPTLLEELKNAVT